MIEVVAALTFTATMLLVVAINARLRLRDARREVRWLGVELDLVTENLRRGSTNPVADSGRDEAAYTEEERRVMGHLVVAWNLYTDLPSDHPDDVNDFKDGIHVLQRIVLANVALRGGGS